MIELAVFDMAGTVIDEQNIVYKTVRRAIENAGFEVDLGTVLLYGAGKEKLQAIRDTLRAITGMSAPDRLALPIFEDFKGLLDTAYHTEEIKEQPGATAIFEYLATKNVRVALNTGYSRPITDLLLQKLGWADSPLIHTVVCADDVEMGRPAPDMILKAMESTGVTDAANVLKIGDSQIDILEGKNAGCGLTFGITTGAQTREQLMEVEPTAVLDALSELNAWV
jgi:phosphonatase-like hydrolase